MDFFIYESARSRIKKQIKKKLSLELLDCLILFELSQIRKEQVEFSELNSLIISKLGVRQTYNISKNISFLSQMGFFKKKRNEEDERSLLIYDINLNKIDQILEVRNKIMIEEVRKTKQYITF